MEFARPWWMKEQEPSNQRLRRQDDRAGDDFSTSRRGGTRAGAGRAP